MLCIADILYENNIDLLMNYLIYTKHIYEIEFDIHLWIMFFSGTALVQDSWYGAAKMLFLLRGLIQWRSLASNNKTSGLKSMIQHTLLRNPTAVEWLAVRNISSYKRYLFSEVYFRCFYLFYFFFNFIFDLVMNQLSIAGSNRGLWRLQGWVVRTRPSITRSSWFVSQRRPWSRWLSWIDQRRRTTWTGRRPMHTRRRPPMGRSMLNLVLKFTKIRRKCYVNSEQKF